MRLLLDTHALIWAAAAPERLPANLREALVDAGNVVAVSAASAWEIAIKRARGRLRFPPIDEQLLITAGYQPLPISIQHAAAVEKLPALHSDPFDRVLVAQAQEDGYTLITRDPAIQRYDVTWLWERL